MRAELKRRKKAARAELKRRKKAMPETEAMRHRRRRRRLVAALILILLLALLPDCRCTPDPGPAAEGAAVEVPEEPEEPALEPITGRVARRDRPDYRSKTPPTLPWIDAFRLQVAARSPRLAECFVGVARPGRLKWTTSVEPSQGKVSQHDIEPTLLSDPLTKRQRTCIIDVLSQPPYQLESGQERSTPARVGLVIEF